MIKDKNKEDLRKAIDDGMKEKSNLTLIINEYKVKQHDKQK